jgi:hypothetical protein
VTLQEQGLIRADDGGLVELQPDLGDALHPGAGGDHHRLAGLIFLLAHPHGAVPSQHPGSLDHGHLVFLHEELDALGVLLRDLA